MFGALKAVFISGPATARAVVYIAGKLQAFRQPRWIQPQLFQVGPGGKTHTADVIFVHGIAGHAAHTWCAETFVPESFWPEWLAADRPSTRVLSVQYPSAITTLESTPAPRWEEVAEQLAFQLDAHHVGRRPTVFVCHSMGGLLVKHVLLFAAERRLDLWENTRGLVFLATPHHGSQLASLFALLASGVAVGSRHVAALEYSSDECNALSSRFQRALQQRAPDRVPMVSVFCETDDTYGLRVVPVASAFGDWPAEGRRPGFNVNHFEIAKLPDRSRRETNPVFRSVLEVIDHACIGAIPTATDLTPAMLDIRSVTTASELEALDSRRVGRRSLWLGFIFLLALGPIGLIVSSSAIDPWSLGVLGSTFEAAPYLPSLEIAAGEAGRIASVNCNLLDKVAAGDLLVQMDTTKLDDLHDEVAAELLAVQSDIVAAVAAQARRFARGERLGPDEPEMTGANEWRLKAAAGALQSVETRIAQQSLRAEMAGEVVAVLHRSGDHVDAGEAILRIRPLETAQVVILVSERNATKFRVGNSLTADISGARQRATVVSIGSGPQLPPENIDLLPAWDPLESTCRHASLSIL